MEPNIKRVRVKKCASKEEINRELVKNLLKRYGPMSLQLLVTFLKSNPYNRKPTEISKALNQLNNMNLITTKKFTDTWLSGSGVDVVIKM